MIGSSQCHVWGCDFPRLRGTLDPYYQTMYHVCVLTHLLRAEHLLSSSDMLCGLLYRSEESGPHEYLRNANTTVSLGG